MSMRNPGNQEQEAQIPRYRPDRRQRASLFSCLPGFLIHLSAWDSSKGRECGVLDESQSASRAASRQHRRIPPHDPHFRAVSSRLPPFPSPFPFRQQTVPAPASPRAPLAPLPDPPHPRATNPLRSTAGWVLPAATTVAARLKRIPSPFVTTATLATFG